MQPEAAVITCEPATQPTGKLIVISNVNRLTAQCHTIDRPKRDSQVNQHRRETGHTLMKAEHWMHQRYRSPRSSGSPLRVGPLEETRSRVAPFSFTLARSAWPGLIPFAILPSQNQTVHGVTTYGPQCAILHVELAHYPAMLITLCLKRSQKLESCWRSLIHRHIISAPAWRSSPGGLACLTKIMSILEGLCFSRRSIDSSDNFRSQMGRWFRHKREQQK